MIAPAATFLVSLIAFLGGLYFYFLHSSRNGDGSLVSKNFFETTPARQLVPRLNPLIRRGWHLLVVTADGSYPESEPGGNLWILALRAWLKLGLRVTYLIVGGRTDSCRTLALLAIEYPDQFSIRFFVASPEQSKDIRSIAEDLYITHPVFLFDEHDKPQALWLERFHSPESSIAMNVSYVSPVDIEASVLKEKHLKRVQLVLDETEATPVDDLKLIVEPKTWQHKSLLSDRLLVFASFVIEIYRRGYRKCCY